MGSSLALALPRRRPLPSPTARDAGTMFRALLPRGGRGRELHRVVPTGVEKASHETGCSFLILITL